MNNEAKKEVIWPEGASGEWELDLATGDLSISGYGYHETEGIKWYECTIPKYELGVYSAEQIENVKADLIAVAERDL